MSLGFAPITLVQHTQKDVTPGVSSTTLAYGSNVTQGNLLVCAVRCGANGITITVADSLGQTWAQPVDVDNSGGGRRSFICYFQNTAGGANTITFTPSTSCTLRIGIAEYSGIARVNALDQATATGNTGTSATADSGNITTTQASELLIGFAERGPGTTFTAGNSFVAEEAVPAAPNSALVFMDRIVSTILTTSASASLGSAAWSAGVASFRGAAYGTVLGGRQSINRSGTF